MLNLPRALAAPGQSESLMETEMTWTDERVMRLRELWAQGFSASQIAGQLGGGVTRNAVIGKVHRLKLSGRAKPANSSQRTRSTSRPGGRRRAGSAGVKPRIMATPIIGATALKPTEVEEEDVRAAPDQATELFIPPEERISLLGLNEKTCKWPIGDPLVSDFYFCGRNAGDSGPYCEFHARRAYHTLERKKR